MRNDSTEESDHAQEFARRWADRLELHRIQRMQQLGIPEDMIGQPDYDGDGRWQAFNPYGRQGGENTTGVVIDSGVLNPRLIEGEKGGRIWSQTRLRDRIDATIAHEYEDLLHGGSHAAAIRKAATTNLPISEAARRLNRARAR